MSENLEKRYGPNPSISLQEARRFHRERRMFVIKDDEVILGPPDFDGSHVDWFLKEGWIGGEDDRLIRDAVRGYISNGNLIFYKGWNFEVDEDLEKEFFSKWVELKQKLTAEEIVVRGVYGGASNYPGASRLLPIRGYEVK